MNPILFDKDETNFTTNGLGRLECISCEVIEERNGMYELEAEVPISGNHAAVIEQQSIIGVIPHDGGNIQAFYVYKIGKPINGKFKVYARHISYRLTDIPCSPFSVETSPTAAADTLAGLKANAIEECPFYFYTDLTTPAPYTQKTPASIRQRLGGVEGSVLDQFGGEFEWDNYNVHLWKQRGRLANVTGISLRYGKNITDIDQEEEISNTVTGVVPFWIDTDGNNLVMLPELVVYSEYADNYPYHLTQVLDLSGEYENKPTVNQLRGAATTYVNKTGLGIPKVSIKVSFVNLWETEEYKDIAPLERVQLCDEVIVNFEELGVSAIAKVVKTRYDVLKERYIQIEVGSIRTTLAQAVTDRDKDIDTAFVSTITKMSQAVHTATAWLTNANGYVVARKNEDGSWKELLFMNTNDPATATSGIRINNNGIGFFSKVLYPAGNVLDGPYSTAWTIDGRLGDAADKNFWNFITGDFSLSAGTTVGGQTVQQIADTAQAAAENTAAAALAAQVAIYDADIADLQNQIDGNVTTWYYSGVPTLSNLPASQWTTTTDKDNHIGDLYYDSATGYAYRFMKDGNNYIWTKISDSDIEAALSEAQDAWDLADNKRRVFITQPVPPYDIGDLWVQGSNGDIKRCATAKTSTQTYSASDWVLASKYTDDTAVTALDNSLNQTEVFNRLIGGDTAQGIVLNNGKLYLRGNYLEAGEITIGGSAFANNPTLKIKDTSNRTIVEGTKDGLKVYNTNGTAIFYTTTDGITTSKLVATDDCTFGNLNIGKKNVQTPIGEQLMSYIYGDGWIEYWYESWDGALSKNTSKTVYFSPYYDGWSDNLDVNVVFSASDTNWQESHDTTVLCQVSLARWTGTTWSTVQTLHINADGNEIDDKDTYFTGFTKNDKTVYRLAMKLIRKTWAEDYDIDVYCDNSHVFELNPYEITGSFRGHLEGSASLYSLSVNDTSISKSGSLIFDDEETRKSYTVSADGFESRDGQGSSSSTDGSVTIQSDSYPSIYIKKASNSSEYINIHTENPVIKVSDGSSKYIDVTTSAIKTHASSSQYTEIDNFIPCIGVYSTSNDYINIQDTYMELHYSSNSNSKFSNQTLTATRSGTSYTIPWTASDRRFKEEIESLDVELSKGLIDATETVKFKYKSDEGKHYGVIAQDVREVLDKLGETDSQLEHSMGVENPNVDDPRTIDYHEFIPHLINYVKDLRAVVDRQQAEIDQLKEIVKKLSM